MTKRTIISRLPSLSASFEIEPPDSSIIVNDWNEYEENHENERGKTRS